MLQIKHKCDIVENAIRNDKLSRHKSYTCAHPID